MSNGTRSNRVSESQLARTEYGHDAVIVIILCFLYVNCVCVIIILFSFLI